MLVDDLRERADGEVEVVLGKKEKRVRKVLFLLF